MKIKMQTLIRNIGIVLLMVPTIYLLLAVLHIILTVGLPLQITLVSGFIGIFFIIANLALWEKQRTRELLHARMLMMLKIKYSKGEIAKEEYEEKKKMLGE